ncbi:hypothetical protein OAU50_07045 [Planctomycetota bacterium]|nr:hypothetical protein [Planctomycetota bacterium]
MKTASAYILTALVLMTGVSLFVASPNFDVVLAEDFKTLKKEYESAKKDRARSVMKRVLPQIAETNDPKAAKFLLKELEADQKARKKGKEGLPGEVRTVLIRALASFTDEESVGEIGEAALDLDSAKSPELSLDQFDFFYALAQMEDVEAANATIRTAIADEKNPYVKIAAIEAVRQAHAERFIGDVCNVLREENKEWRTKWHILPVNVFACLKDIVDSEDKESVYMAVEAAIAWEDSKPENNKRVYYFAYMMLFEITGEGAGLRESQAFWKWWIAQTKLVGKAEANNNAPKKGHRSETDDPIVFGGPPVGNRIVFVIDTSDSMKLELKIDLDDLIKKKPKGGPVSGKTKKDKEKDAADAAKEAEDPLKQLPWKEIETKMDLARHELARSIKALQGDFFFAIVTYSTEIECITDGFVQATKGNCNKWADEALELEPDAMTNIHGGIMRGLRVSDSGSDAEHPAVDKNCVMTGADTIIFLTDGWATWDDQSEGRITDKRNKVEDSIGDGPFVYGEDIWPDIIRHNIFRKVVISTVGIGNHDKDLLKKLAKKTGGSYTDWYFEES